MKISPILAFFVACAPMAAHAQTDVPDVAALPMAPKSAATSDAFVWRFAPPVGSKWTMRSFTRATSNTNTPAMNGEKAHSMKFVSISKMTADYDIIGRDALGATTIRMTVRDLTSDINSVVDGKTVKAPATPNAKSVNGATLTIKQASDGAIWGIAGMRAFQRKLLEASGTLDAATVTRILDANPMTNDSNLVKSLSSVGGTLPKSPVRVGESWTYDVDLPRQLMFALSIAGTRTLKSLTPDVAVVSDSAMLNGGDASQKMSQMPGMEKIDVDYSQLSGALSGTTRVQRSSGLPLETTNNLTLRGKISTKTPAMDGAPAQTITVPLDVTTATRMVLEPR